MITPDNLATRIRTPAYAPATLRETTTLPSH
jgi:hypothetical protein